MTTTTEGTTMNIDTTSEIERAIAVARTAFGANHGGNWADAVDAALTAAGFRALDAVAYGAERDTSMIAVVDIDERPHTIHRYDTGAWRCEAVAEVQS